MPGIIPLIGGTKEEALAIYKHFQELLIPESAVKHLSEFLELDLSSYSLHEPLPELPDVSTINGQKGRYQIIVESAKKDNLTLAQAATKFASSRMHHVVCGTAEEIADMMEQWLNEQACDGFNILPPYFPGGFEEFVNQVIPILQERELFRKDYTGTTLREHLGLKRPVNAFYENKKTELVYGEK